MGTWHNHIGLVDVIGRSGMDIWPHTNNGPGWRGFNRTDKDKRSLTVTTVSTQNANISVYDYITCLYKMKLCLPVKPVNGWWTTPITGLPSTATHTMVVTYLMRFSVSTEAETMCHWHLNIEHPMTRNPDHCLYWTKTLQCLQGVLLLACFCSLP